MSLTDILDEHKDMLSMDGLGDDTGGGGRYGGGCLTLLGLGTGLTSWKFDGMPTVFCGELTGVLAGDNTLAYFDLSIMNFSPFSVLEHAILLTYSLNLMRASSITKCYVIKK